MTQRFYALYTGEASRPNVDLEPGLSGDFWRPTWRELVAPGLAMWPFAAWWVLHQGRIFTNRDYAVYLIRKGDEIVHRSCVFPGYFRFPFMEHGDLQIGDTWTASEFRGHGLAKWALAEVLRLLGRPGRRFWYLTEIENVPSIRVAEAVGFRLIGEGRRTRRCGLRILGSFELDTALT